MADYGAFFAGTWHRLRQAELYACGPSLGNPGWAEAALRVLVLRLSPFRDVDRSTPHLFLAQAVRAAEPGAFLDFCFFPPEADRRLLESSGVPPATGIASRRSLEDFDLLLASCSYHLELLNLYYLLVPRRRAAAGQRARRVLPAAGRRRLQRHGRAGADLSGRGLPGRRPVLRRGRGRGGGPGAHPGRRGAGEPKKARLEAAAAVRGFWPAGSLEREVTQAVWPPGGLLAARRLRRRRRPLPPYPVLPGPEAATARLTLSYGCPFRCSFCFEGYERRPYRPMPAGELLEEARRLKRCHAGPTPWSWPAST